MNLTWTSEEERKAYRRAVAHEEVTAAYAVAGLTGMRGVIAAIREERRRAEWHEDSTAIQLGEEIARHRLAMLVGHEKWEPEAAMGEGWQDGE